MKTISVSTSRATISLSRRDDDDGARKPYVLAYRHVGKTVEFTSFRNGRFAAQAFRNSVRIWRGFDRRWNIAI